jgi:SagB-type dehydrogenase family enzyme
MLRSNWELLETSDQQKGEPLPDRQKPCPPDASITALPDAEFAGLSDVKLVDGLLNRRSVRKYTSDSLTMMELSFLLFATQGVQKELKKASLRPPASAGARHPFELYVAVFRVEGITPALYRYLPFDHALCLVAERADLREAADEALEGQGWRSAITLFWTAIPYRTEWRYTVASHKLIALDAGHSCQNLYLACEAVGCGTCAIGAYDQVKCDALLGVDGTDELTVYAAPVGKV